MENANVGKDQTRELRIAFYVIAFAIGYLFYKSAYGSGFHTGFASGYNSGQLFGFGTGYEHGARVGYEEARIDGNTRNGITDLSEYARQARESEESSSEREGGTREDTTAAGDRARDNRSEEGARKV